MTELLQFVWLMGLTGFSGWQWWRARQVSRDVAGKREAVRQLRARQAGLSLELEQLQSPDPEERLSAAKAIIRKRAESRR